MCKIKNKKEKEERPVPKVSQKGLLGTVPKVTICLKRGKN